MVVVVSFFSFICGIKLLIIACSFRLYLEINYGNGHDFFFHVHIHYA